VIAIDPEIPSGRQAVLFKARGDVAGLRWFLDGKALTASAAPLFWHPEPGAHELTLAARKGKVTDRVHIEVIEVRARDQSF
jgi:membrane carboxypeptidase/penicillin-binding protein PbpC